MKKILTIILALLPVLAFSQIKYDSVRVVKPQNFVEAMSIDTAIVQIISQKAGANRRVNFQTVADWILAQQPNLDSAQYANDTLLLFYGPDTIMAVIPSGTIDTAYLSGDTLGIVFAGDTTEVVLAGLGDGDGIYSGSGTVPASTWVEQLGSLIFDIDSIGSFTVGDIDEKSTGAYISISNTGGNDGAIVMKSGSGKGTTDATIELNNYYLPGTTPTGEGLASGDYIWIVSQAGVRKGQDSTGWIHIDSLLQGYTTGSGTSGTLPIWTGANALGNSSLTESGQVISSSLTGAFKLPTGTNAQDPTGAAGLIRYSTTDNGIRAWNGATSSYMYLPWSSSDNYAAGTILVSNGSQLVSSNMSYNSGISDFGISSAGLRFYTAGEGIGSLNESMRIIFDEGNSRVQHLLGINNARFTVGSAAGNVIVESGLSNLDIFVAGTYFEANPRTRLSVQRAVGANAYYGINSNTRIYSHTYTTANAYHIEIKPGHGGGIYNGGDVDIEAGGTRGNAGIHTGVTGIISMKVAVDKDTAQTSAYKAIEVSGRNKIRPTIHLFHLDDTGTGIKTLTMEADTVKYRIENIGTISTSTDGSGDIVVAHGMGVTPTSVQVTVTGTTPYVVTVHSIDATNFTVRFYDMTGAAVTSTAVTATWHAKT